MAKAPSLADKKTIQLYNTLNFLALENEPRAQASLEALLGLDPDADAPTMSSPSVRAFFARVKGSYRVIPKIEHVPPLEIDDSQGADIAASVTRMRPGYMLRLHYRKSGQTSYSVIDLGERGPGTYGARVPTAMLVSENAYRLEYFIQATFNDEVLVAVGSAANPLSVPVAKKLKVEKPVTQRWWFWTLLVGGAAVAAGAATAGVVDGRAPLSLDLETLPAATP